MQRLGAAVFIAYFALPLVGETLLPPIGMWPAFDGPPPEGKYLTQMAPLVQYRGNGDHKTYFEVVNNTQGPETVWLLCGVPGVVRRVEEIPGEVNELDDVFHVSVERGSWVEIDAFPGEYAVESTIAAGASSRIAITVDSLPPGLWKAGCLAYGSPQNSLFGVAGLRVYSLPFIPTRDDIFIDFDAWAVGTPVESIHDDLFELRTTSPNMSAVRNVGDYYEVTGPRGRAMLVVPPSRDGGIDIGTDLPVAHAVIKVSYAGNARMNIHPWPRDGTSGYCGTWSSGSPTLVPFGSRDPWLDALQVSTGSTEGAIKGVDEGDPISADGYVCNSRIPGAWFQLHSGYGNAFLVDEIRLIRASASPPLPGPVPPGKYALVTGR